MKRLDYSSPTDLFYAITIFALRFDGYKYRQENTNFDDFKNYKLFLDGKEIPDDELLPSLFCAQRSLSKAQYTREDEEYKMLLILASKCIEKNEEIAEKYKNEEYCGEWEKIKGDADEIVKAIAKIK
ncbi:MAG: hypothetical protein HEQ13_11835 [Dolichospermum sp. DEX189]|jgi:hypothetical protein|uniref:Uncharacterized protein n=1 Tax=Aphanizomenon flos-aquae FACHB-1040 TaxID=2692887 RepID=A0ABR8C0K9_APHFL|nr:hypothetical protein [Aphanizomenon flos-aquae]MBD2280407.1 hypothetical protein [Aphanizomenon flos-aquae FACHB-1040]MBO1070014.1 hypothetical protein [Dolichospermum sp. DEX189]